MQYIENVNVENKKVIVRVDFNVPIKDGVVEDNNRIKAALETINYLISNNAKVILLSHLGKIKTEEDKLKNDMKFVLPELEKLLGKKVYYSNETKGNILEESIASLQNGDVLLVQNTRYEDLPDKLESGCDEELSKYWASLCDLYVMDAFGSAHRKHASTCGIAEYKETAIGFLMKKEMEILDEVINSSNKTLILGGAKAEDKIQMIDKLAPTSSYILIGGLMAMPFLKALNHNTGASSFSEEALSEAKRLLDLYKDKIVLPLDFITSKSVDGETVIKGIDEFEDDDLQFDIGPETLDLYKSILFKSTLILWNGPMGLFENVRFENGTMELIDLLSDFNAKVILAGGDTSSAAKKAYLDMCFTISTGGGASLEYLGGSEFPILELLNKK